MVTGAVVGKKRRCAARVPIAISNIARHATLVLIPIDLTPRRAPISDSKNLSSKGVWIHALRHKQRRRQRRRRRQGVIATQVESIGGLADKIKTVCTFVTGDAVTRITETPFSAPSRRRDVARVETNTIICVALAAAAHAPFVVVGVAAASIVGMVGDKRGRCKWEWALVV
jgi:hypothetical protein